MTIQANQGFGVSVFGAGSGGGGGGGGTPGGLDTQVQFNSSGSFGASANLTFVSPALTIGAQQTTQGKIVFANTAAGAFATTMQSSNSASAAWTLTLPATAGTANYALTTNGSGVSSWSQISLTAGVTGVLPIANGGTNASSFTTNYVTYFDGTRLTGGSGLQYNGTTLSTTNDATVNSLTVGKGGGAVSTNTAFGVNALAANTTGARNIAVGNQALKTITTASDNVAIGHNALTVSTAGGQLAVGSSALAASTTAVGNVALGNSALAAITTGNYNVGIGQQALGVATTGLQNVAIGYQALSSTDNYDCLAIGYLSGATNTTGSVTAVGSQTLRYNTTGGGNAAIGSAVLTNNTTGNGNIGIGAVWPGNLGACLASNTTGSFNVGVGTGALGANVTNSNSTAVGYSALVSSTANSNTALGYRAGLNVTTGDNNVFLGADSGTDALVNVTTASNVVVLGNNNTATLYCKTSTITTSDIRDKIITGGVPHGLDFVKSLNPIEYKFRKNRDVDYANDGEPNRYGFSAQEILALEKDNPTIIDAHDPDNLKFAGAHLIPVLVNAIKDLSAKVDQLSAELVALKNDK